jgi:hypothetical protein
MTMPLSSGIWDLHQLAWLPAKFAHPLWLAAIGIKAENYHYGRSHVLDNTLNRVLIQQRKFPQHPLPAVLSSQQQVQMASHQRLLSHCLALGLVHLQCDDYLRLRRYRQALSPHLNESDIQQLIGLGFRGPLSARLTPQQLPTVALSLGHSLAHQQRYDDVVWQAISIRLPPLPRALSLPTALSLSVDHWLTRLVRFL